VLCFFCSFFNAQVLCCFVRTKKEKKVLSVLLTPTFSGEAAAHRNWELYEEEAELGAICVHAQE
jgi:hypothetical protein